VVVRESAVSGDGVNIASRICSLSEGSGITLADRIRKIFYVHLGLEAL
jgi:class 3 adenylate cyclase